MSGGGEIVFVPVLIPVAAGVGVVFVAVGAGMAAAMLADLGADVGIEAIGILGEIAVRSVAHLHQEYESAVRQREQRSIDDLRREALSLSGQREQAARAVQVIERTRTRLSGSATTELLVQKTSGLRALAALVGDQALAREVSRLEADARHGAPSEMVASIVELQGRLISAAERVVRQELDALDPVLSRQEVLRDLLAKVEHAIRITLTDPFIPDDKRTLYADRLEKLLRDADATGLDATVRTVRTLEENIVRAAREAMEREVLYRQAYARAVSAVAAVSRCAPADPRTQVAAQTLQMRLEQLAEHVATAEQVDAIAEAARSELEAAQSRADTLRLAAASQQVVAKALVEQGCMVHYVPTEAAQVGWEPMIVPVDDRVGVKITFADEGYGAIVAHTEMVAFDAGHAIADDITQTRVCRFVEDLASRMGAQDFQPRWVEAGYRLEVVAHPDPSTDEETSRRRKTVLKAMTA